MLMVLVMDVGMWDGEGAWISESGKELVMGKSVAVGGAWVTGLTVGHSTPRVMQPNLG